MGTNQNNINTYFAARTRAVENGISMSTKTDAMFFMASVYKFSYGNISFLMWAMDRRIK
jgi:hypothetical protein